MYFISSAPHKEKKKHKHKHKHKHSHDEDPNEEKRHKHSKHKKHKKRASESKPPVETATPKRTRLEDKRLEDLERARELLTARLLEAQSEDKGISLVSGDYESDENSAPTKAKERPRVISVGSEEEVTEHDNDDVVFVKSTQQSSKDKTNRSRKFSENNHRQASVVTKNKENKHPIQKNDSSR